MVEARERGSEGSAAAFPEIGDHGDGQGLAEGAGSAGDLESTGHAGGQSLQEGGGVARDGVGIPDARHAPRRAHRDVHGR